MFGKLGFILFRQHRWRKLWKRAAKARKLQLTKYRRFIRSRYREKEARLVELEQCVFELNVRVRQANNLLRVLYVTVENPNHPNYLDTQYLNYLTEELSLGTKAVERLEAIGQLKTER